MNAPDVTPRTPEDWQARIYDALQAETLATREIERRDDPSTKRLRIWTRVSMGNLFMPGMI